MPRFTFKPKEKMIDATAESTSCPHEYIMSEGICAGCGLVCSDWSYGGRTFHSKGSTHVQNKVSTRTIIPDLNKYRIPDDIKNEADSIFHRIGAPTKRGNERNKMLFFCVYMAYKEKGHQIMPATLAKEMGLAPGQANKSLTTFSEVQTGYRPRSKKTLPVDLLPELCEKLQLDHITSEVMETAREILKKAPLLLEEFPSKVAAGILRYYTEINGIQINPVEFQTVVGFSDVTINDIHDRVSAIHNQ